MFSFCLSSFFVCVCQPFYRLAYGCQDLFFNFPQFSDTQRLSSQHADQIFCPVPFHKEACFQSLVRLLIKAFQNITFTKYCFPHLFQFFVPFPFSVNCFSGFDIHLGYSCVFLCCVNYRQKERGCKANDFYQPHAPNKFLQSFPTALIISFKLKTSAPSNLPPEIRHRETMSNRLARLVVSVKPIGKIDLETIPHSKSFLQLLSTDLHAEDVSKTKTNRVLTSKTEFTFNCLTLLSVLRDIPNFIATGCAVCLSYKIF